MGNSPRLGSVMKLVGNFFIMSMMELIGEGLTLADKTGLQRDAVVQFLKESFQGPITGGGTFLRQPHSKEPDSAKLVKGAYGMMILYDKTPSSLETMSYFDIILQRI